MSEGGLRLGVRRAVAARHAPGARGSAIRRRAIAAGDAYPADASTLHAAVTELLDGVSVPVGERLARAYVVPHGSLEVAGALSARAYARLRVHAAAVRRVVLLGPMHGSVPMGCFVSRASVWETPLGPVEVDTDVMTMLERDGHVHIDTELHGRQTSLEAQLPFLRVAAPTARIVPVLVGATGTDDVVVTLSAILAHAESRGDGETVVIATAGLTADARNPRTLEAVFDLAGSRITTRDVCGAYALRGVLAWAHHSDLRAELLGAGGRNFACALHDWLIDDG